MCYSIFYEKKSKEQSRYHVVAVLVLIFFCCLFSCGHLVDLKLCWPLIFKTSNDIHLSPKYSKPACRKLIYHCLSHVLIIFLGKTVPRCLFKCPNVFIIMNKYLRNRYLEQEDHLQRWVIQDNVWQFHLWTGIGYLWYLTMWPLLLFSHSAANDLEVCTLVWLCPSSEQGVVWAAPIIPAWWII